MQDLYFGSVEKILQFYFRLFKAEEKEILNLQDVLLSFRYLTSDKEKIKSFENIIKKFEKNSQTSLMSFTEFDSFILYEDSRLLINFFKLINEKQPFSVKSIEYFIRLTDVDQEMNESFSSTDELKLMSTLNFDSSNLMSNLEENVFRFYERSHKKFIKTKLMLINNNIFVYKKNIYNSEYIFENCIPTSVFFSIKEELNVKSRVLSCLDLH